MNKMLVAVFRNEPAAYEGLGALKELHKDGDISLYATAVIAKDASGAVSVKQAVEEGPVGTALGMLTGSMVGLLAGPVGLAAGAWLGTMTGALFDLNRSGINIDFLDEVSKALSPGKAAVLADVEETWVTPVDTKIGRLGGLVFRRLRSEVVEDQLARERAAFDAELRQLQDELAQASADHKAALQKEIETVKSKIDVTRAQAKARALQVKNEMEAKVSALANQMRQASAREKARLEKRIAEVKADHEARSAKLRQAHELIKEALLS
jgi:uncharacterized membrane protein